MDGTSLVSSFQMLLEHVENSGEWLIAVCPSSSTTYSNCRLTMVSSIPSGSYFSGRTIRFEDGGMLSLFSKDTPIPEDMPFTVSFLGWDRVDTQDTDTMREWRKKSNKVLTFGGVEV